MACTPVLQKPLHCVPACLESIAKDYSLSETQETIVQKFPEVFPNGVLEDLGKPRTLNDVIQTLGLGGPIACLKFANLDQFKTLSVDHEILLIWTKVSKHCVRFCSYDNGTQQITVMDPGDAQFHKYDLNQLNTLQPDLVFFKKK